MIDNSLLTIKNLERAYSNMGFSLNKDGFVNICGIRTKGGEFNDIFMYFKYSEGIPIFLPAILGTTEPGSYYLGGHLGNPEGTAVLIHDRQYIDCWVGGYHHTQEALVQSQKAKFAVWRDSNKNGIINYGSKEYHDVGGLNNHTTKEGYVRDFVYNWSAGCQVIWNEPSFEHTIIPFCKGTGQKYFSYALFYDETFEKVVK
jgi:hypothetical protein